MLYILLKTLIVMKLWSFYSWGNRGLMACWRLHSYSIVIWKLMVYNQSPCPSLAPSFLLLIPSHPFLLQKLKTMYICIYFTPNLERHAAWIVRTSICLCVGIAGRVFVITLERNVNSTDGLLRSKISILGEGYSPRAEGFLLVNNIAEEIVAMDGQLG